MSVYSICAGQAGTVLVLVCLQLCCYSEYISKVMYGV